MRKDQIALQLYTVRDPGAADYPGTLRAVASAGYRAVELAGYGGMTPAALRDLLDETGLRAMGAHVPFARFEEDLDSLLAELRLLGCDFAIIPSLPNEYRESLSSARRAAERFNRWGERTRGAGLRFGYHNHAFEFAPLDGGRLFDLLVTETDPTLVAFELDLFWIHYGGADPAALIAQLGERAPLLHLKDMEAGEERADAPVGDGIMPWDALLAAGRAANAEWYIVEQDHPRDPLPDVARSLRALEGMATGN